MNCNLSDQTQRNNCFDKRTCCMGCAFFFCMIYICYNYFMQIFTAIPFWIWITVSAIFFALGEFFSKKFALNPGWTLFVLFIMIDFVSAATWLPAIFEKNQLSTTGVIWSIASVGATVLIGVLAFSEKLTLIQCIGLAFGFVSVVLLSL